MTTNETLLSRIAQHLAATGMSERAFSIAATGGDHKLLSRLRAGRDVTSSTIDCINAVIAGEPVPLKRGKVCPPVEAAAA